MSVEKWIALALVVVGFALIVRAFCHNKDASFDDGSFLILIVQFMAGCGLMGAGAIVFIVILFRML